MRQSLFSLLLSAALLSSAPAWSAPKKPADKAAPAKQPAEKTVTGKLISVEDNGSGETYTVETPDGKKVQVNADPGTSRPENVKDGAPVVMTYAEVTELRVSEVRPAKGPAFKKKPASTVQGTLVGYERGDMGDYIVIDKGGRQDNYLADFNVLSEEQVTSLAGKKLELALYPFTQLELRDIKPGP
jgi:hypothetical protein